MTSRVLLSCGEPSGDLYAGALTRELHALAPGISVRGLGGPGFAAAGGELIGDYRGIAVTGLTEVIAKLPRSFTMLTRLVAAARAERPDVLVVIDFPDFNFRLARRVKALGVPVVYYVSPQIWAWRPGRMRTIREIADRVLVIFPFEVDIYEKAGVPVEFVGHPLVDLARASASRESFLLGVGFTPSAPTIAILPGSRPNEIGRILPDLLKAAREIRARVPGAQFVVARAPNLEDDQFGLIQREASLPITVVEGHTDTVLASADVALTASGTATVQTALHDTPMVVVYRLSALTYLLGRPLVKVDTYAMVNLIAGERIVPELIQGALTPKAVADEAVSMLTDRARAQRIREGLARVRARLGGPGASRRAAEAVLRVTMNKTLLIFALVLLGGARLPATTLLPADLGELARDAQVIVRGQIMALDARWTDDHRTIETIVTLQTDAYLKGQLGATVDVRVPGGRLGRFESVMIGAPQFAVGQRVILFLGARGPSVPYVLGLSQGVFRVTQSGGDWVVTPPAILSTSERPVAIVRGDLARRPLPLGDFERQVRALAQAPR